MITNDDIKEIDFYHDLINKGMYGDSTTITKLYNRLLSKNQAVTNCGSCIRRLVLEMVDYKDKLIKETTNG